MTTSLNQLFEASISGWVLVVTFAVLLFVNEIGYRLGRRQAEERLGPRRSQADLLVPALLGLLGLLLAFSFDMVQTRFDRRRTLVVEDANAIGTTYLRAKTLPAPYDERLQALLREYIAYRTRGTTEAEVEVAIARSAVLHREMWEQTTEIARAQPDSVIVGRFIESLNKMIDLHETRITVALIERMPRPIIWVLFLISGLSVGMAGFRSGLDHTRAVIPMTVLTLAITAVLALIVDIDKPTSRIFEISQRPMFDISQVMARDTKISGQLAPR
jgi:hypothetical protein